MEDVVQPRPLKVGWAHGLRLVPGDQHRHRAAPQLLQSLGQPRDEEALDRRQILAFVDRDAVPGDVLFRQLFDGLPGQIEVGEQARRQRAAGFFKTHRRGDGGFGGTASNDGGAPFDIVGIVLPLLPGSGKAAQAHRQRPADNVCVELVKQCRMLPRPRAECVRKRRRLHPEA